MLFQSVTYRTWCLRWCTAVGCQYRGGTAPCQQPPASLPEWWSDDTHIGTSTESTGFLQESAIMVRVCCWITCINSLCHDLLSWFMTSYTGTTSFLFPSTSVFSFPPSHPFSGCCIQFWRWHYFLWLVHYSLNITDMHKLLMLLV